MEAAIKKTDQQRKMQLAYNQKHGIVPKTTTPPTDNLLFSNQDTPSKEPKLLRKEIKKIEKR